MLSAKSIIKIQAEFKLVSNNVVNLIMNDEITFEEYWNQYRSIISKQNPDSYAKATSEKKTEIMLQRAMEYVNKHSNVKVKGYIGKDGMTDTSLLLEDLCSTITGEAVFKEALENPEIDEIDLVDQKTLFVEKGGMTIPYVDKYGRRVSFPSDEAIKTALNKLMEDGNGNTPQFTEGIPILNGRTYKDKHRVNAVHPSVNTKDFGEFSFPITTVSIRKSKKTALTIDYFMKNDSCSENMGELFYCMGKTRTRNFCIGETGSGKTSLLGAIARGIPYDKKVILVQNPTEIFLTERDEFGVNKRIVNHWEVREDEVIDKSGKKATMENLIANALRANPSVIIVGECRSPGEFFQTYRAAKTGHTLFASFHSFDAEEALSRAAMELASNSGASYNECLRMVAGSTDFIIAPVRYFTGERKVKAITEVCGMDLSGKLILNDLFRYKAEGSEIDEKTGKEKMKGRFIQTGSLSEKRQELFLECGIPKEKIMKFVLPTKKQLAV